MTKHKVKETFSDYITLDGMVVDVIKRLQDFIKKYPEHDLELYSYSYGYDGGTEVSLCGYRDETKEEEKIRVLRELKAKEKADKAKKSQTEREKAQLAILLKKYPNYYDTEIDLVKDFKDPGQM